MEKIKNYERVEKEQNSVIDEERQKTKMRVWVDADACPKTIKEILFRAAKRTQTIIILVSNQPLYVPTSPYIQKIVVPSGFDVADTKIVESMKKGDLVITADIPLAHRVVEKGGVAIDPRGDVYTKNNVKQRLSIRNLNAELRGAGMLTGGPSGLSKKEVLAFANALDKFLGMRI